MKLLFILALPMLYFSAQAMEQKAGSASQESPLQVRPGGLLNVSRARLTLAQEIARLQEPGAPEKEGERLKQLCLTRAQYLGFCLPKNPEGRVCYSALRENIQHLEQVMAGRPTWKEGLERVFQTIEAYEFFGAENP